jgi:hypothetical protein
MRHNALPSWRADRLSKASRFIQVGDSENHTGLPGGFHRRGVARGNVNVLGGELPSNSTKRPWLIWDLDGGANVFAESRRQPER